MLKNIHLALKWLTYILVGLSIIPLLGYIALVFGIVRIQSGFEGLSFLFLAIVAIPLLILFASFEAYLRTILEKRGILAKVDNNSIYNITNLIIIIFVLYFLIIL